MIKHVERMIQVERLVHEPARFAILAILDSVEEVEFGYLLRETGLTQGNLSAHLGKLEAGELIVLEKAIVGKRPKTTVRITGLGRSKLKQHCQTLRSFLKFSGY